MEKKSGGFFSFVLGAFYNEHGEENDFFVLQFYYEESFQYCFFSTISGVLLDFDRYVL